MNQTRLERIPGFVLVEWGAMNQYCVPHKACIKYRWGLLTRSPDQNSDIATWRHPALNLSLA
jgi:hypothetical protein